MTPKELFEFLDKHDLDYELVEIFEGVRIVAIEVEEEEEPTMEDEDANDERKDNKGGVLGRLDSGAT
jgi:molybdopterin-guanine dinucleotide biosynthesis protein